MMEVMSQTPVSVLMVCMGNICRSPMAECVFRHKARQRGVEAMFNVDSAGTGNWHVGEPPDHRIQRVAQINGIELVGNARQIHRDDFARFDHIICMDAANLEHLLAMGAPANRTRLLLDVLPAQAVREVPDPYYGGDEGFSEVFRLVDAACDALLDELLADRS
jgi:protein-tyrosine phosphatase